MNTTTDSRRNQSKSPTPAAVPRTQPDQGPIRTLHRSFDYGGGYGNRSGYTGGRRYADLPSRGLFHCG